MSEVNTTNSTVKSYIRVIREAPTKLDARLFNYKADRQTDMARAREMNALLDCVAP